MATNTFTISPAFIDAAISQTIAPIYCNELHPHSCNAKAVSQFFSGCKSLYKMYLIVHLLPAILFRRKKFKENPSKEIKKIVTGFIKSLLFAGGYSMLVRRLICLLTSFHGFKVRDAFWSGMFAGVTLAFEPVSRQSEIALFCLNKSMEVSYNMLRRRDWPIRIPYGECWLAAVALAIISYVYVNEPETFRENYRKVLDKLLKDC